MGDEPFARKWRVRAVTPNQEAHDAILRALGWRARGGEASEPRRPYPWDVSAAAVLDSGKGES